MKSLAGALRILAAVVIVALAGWSLFVALSAFLLAMAEGSGTAALIGGVFVTLAIALFIMALYLKRGTRPAPGVVPLVVGASLFVSLLFLAWWFWGR